MKLFKGKSTFATFLYFLDDFLCIFDIDIDLADKLDFCVQVAEEKESRYN